MGRALEHLLRAEAAERQAALATAPGLKRGFLNLAVLWRELARQANQLEPGRSLLAAVYLDNPGLRHAATLAKVALRTGDRPSDPDCRPPSRLTMASPLADPAR